MAKVRWDLRVEEEMAAWVDEYAEHRSVAGQPPVSRTQIVELALKELRALAAGGEPELPERKRAPRRSSSTSRRCFVCRRCAARKFLTVEPEGVVPSCSDHGPMARDSNRPYFNQEVSL